MEVVRHTDDQARDRNRLHWLTHVVVHRLSLSSYHKTQNPHPVPDCELTPEDVVRFFRNREVGTGGLVPYHVLIPADESTQVWQMLPLMARGNHAGGINSRSLAVAVIGNTDKWPCTPRQHERLVEVCADLTMFRRGGLILGGHTDLSPSEKWPDKRCPGKYLSIHALEMQAQWRMPIDFDSYTQIMLFDRATERGYQIELSSVSDFIV